MTHTSQKDAASHDTESAKAERSSRRDVLIGTAAAVTATAASLADAAAKPLPTELAAKLSTVEEWGKPIAVERMPVVFNFRPDRIVSVAPEKLKDWEKLFAERVGLKPERAGGLVGMHPDETISGSGNDWDDCDYV
ncbi:MAG: hypothetical protein HOP13_01520 [Alphaproteobacteria bacterium]|nr:hypothetical protein [Alphaproteobacteria bacterium]